MSGKKSIEILASGRGVKVAWYPGASASAIEGAIRTALGLTASEPLVLLDPDGDVVAVDDSLPGGLRLTLRGASQAIPAPPLPAPPPIEEVPGPRPYPLVGNIPDLTREESSNASLMKLIRQYGRFVRLKVPGRFLFLNADADLVQDLVNRPEVFQKIIPDGDRAPLANLRAHSVGDGLFTAHDTEEIWAIAHRVLLPALGATALKNYYPRLVEVCDELLDRIGTQGPDRPFLATDLMTRMTFEAIAYTGFNTRFNCIQAEEPPPFVQAMVDVLEDVVANTGNLLPSFFHPIARGKRERADALLRETADRIIRERRAALERGEAMPSDLLQVMLTTRDRVTGKKLPDDNIRNQLNTFLVAGHETTSGLLSYALYHLIRNPEVERRLVEEVDQVLGRDHSYRPSVLDIERLDYTMRVLKETLRLDPTAPGFIKAVQNDAVIGGRYTVPKGSVIVSFLPALHRDPRHWGPDPERFDPDRFLPENIARRHPDAYHPFGIGMRACIGFQFALLEARLVLARLYQRFRFRLADPDYRLRHVDTLTVKPRDLMLLAEERPGERGHRPSPRAAVAAVEPPSVASGPRVSLLYGSNMGASQELAQSLGSALRADGFAPSIREMDGCVGALPRGEPVLLICSTYNGKAPDNAARFVAWLEQAAPGSLQGVRYAVLGCGNRQWRTTFQRIPRLLDERLAALGAERVHPPGECDADGDFDAAAERWCSSLRRVLRESAGVGAAPAPEVDVLRFRVELANFAGGRASTLPPGRGGAQEGAILAPVLVNRELQGAGSGRSTRHLEIALPEGVTYAAGDHLGVFPENPPELVHLAASRCGAREGDTVLLTELTREPQGHLPTGVPVAVRELLALHVDLTGPLTRRELRALAARCPCPPERVELERLASEDGFKEHVLDARLTLLDVLERHRSIPCDLALLLSLRPALKPRYYSISSSPRVLSGACSITVGVHEFDGPGGGRREGLCSHHLARSGAGSRVRVVVKDTGTTFRLPPDPTTPLLLIGPGTGLAPFRGFLQERAALRAEGKAVGKVALFFGCRHPDHDLLYRDELEGWKRDGLLSSLSLAFSRVAGEPKTYVQQRLLENSQETFDLLASGAWVYVCGDARRMAPDVRAALVEVLVRRGGLSPGQASDRLDAMQAEGRYLQDVWAS